MSLYRKKEKLVIKRSKIITIAIKDLYRIRLGIGKKLEIELEGKKKLHIGIKLHTFYKNKPYKNIRFLLTLKVKNRPKNMHLKRLIQNIELLNI